MSSKINPKVWPIGISLSILAVAGFCVWTVRVAMANPVELDNTYFASYRDLDMNANKIIIEQQKFDKRYNINIEKKDFIIGENSLEIKLSDKQNKSVDDATIDVVITRPFTTRTDKTLELLSAKDGIYKFKPFKIEQLGRWQIQSKIAVNDLTAYNKLEVNATN